MRNKTSLLMGLTVFLFVAVSFVFADNSRSEVKHKILDPQGIERLKSETGARTKVTISDATGGVRFLVMPANARLRMSGVDKAGSANDKSAAFLRDHGSIFGLSNAAADLKLQNEKSDHEGG